MGMNWTKEQQEVIDTRDSNILVSAAAGSGKTAVLVERIITRLTRDENPISIDELLIVTYTESAAAEMKERILAAIEKALENDPGNIHLQTQSTLIHNASITTIHSFCMSVIKTYFYTIDLDPVFRVGEEGELKLLRSEVMEALLEEEYSHAMGIMTKEEPTIIGQTPKYPLTDSSTPEEPTLESSSKKAHKPSNNFLEFVETFATGKSDYMLGEIIESIYNYSRSYPQPDLWLKACSDLYAIETLEALNQSTVGMAALTDIKQRVAGIKLQLDKALEIAREEDGPDPYLEALVVDEYLINQLIEANTLETYGHLISNYKWTVLSRKKGDNVCANKKEQVKFLRDMVKDTVKKLEEDYFQTTIETQLKNMMDSKVNVEEIVRLVGVFGERYEETKRKRNLIDFGDMEQYAMRILNDTVEGKLVPSAVAQEYQEKFAEVMIDEYQDSNLIQEAILGSVSGNSSGRYNMFMVGDVKQSIYRFRLSRPELFMEKFHRYTLGGGKERRIDLHKNFRSRGEVLDPTNHLFYKIMNENLGGVEYNEGAALYVGAAFQPQSGNQMELRIIDEAQIEGSKETTRQLEAREVARRMKELVGHHMVVDKTTGGFRPATYSDMVILTRSLSGWSDVFADILEDEGIPVDVGSRGGYFQSWEIALLMDYLRVIDNPRQDIPLAAVLSSMFGELTSDEMARIHNTFPGLSFCEGVYAYQSVNHHTEESISPNLDHEATQVNESQIDEVKIEECNQPRKEMDEALVNKLTKCLDTINHYRSINAYGTVYQLIWSILENTGYKQYVASLSMGEQRLANVEMLLEKAVSFEDTSYKGLFNFIRYVELLEKYSVEYGEAATGEGTGNAVSIMSIHKSKGLEFPIVFVVGIGKKFNTQDTKGKVLVDSHMGLGIHHINSHKRTQSKLLPRTVMARKLNLENQGEELRVLYVAMTRAKEKLILTGHVKNLSTTMEKIRLKCADQGAVVSYDHMTSSATYLDWILPAMCNTKGFDPVWKYLEQDIHITHPDRKRELAFEAEVVDVNELIKVATEDIEQLIKENVRTEGELQKITMSETMLDTKNHVNQVKEVNTKRIDTESSDHVTNITNSNHIVDTMDYIYPYIHEADFKVKVTVSELKKRPILQDSMAQELIPTIREEVAHIEEPVFTEKEGYIEVDSIPPTVKSNKLIPEFMKDTTEITHANWAAMRGNAYHRFMELWDYTKDVTMERIESYLEQQIASGKLSQEYGDLIHLQDIYQFLTSDLGCRMKRAATKGKLYKEQPFVMGIPAAEVYQVETEEVTLLQGIIDVYFIEDQRAYVVDFKTDKVRDGQQLIERYGAQLGYYARAVAQLTGYTVEKQLIYSFHKKTVVEI